MSPTFGSLFATSCSIVMVEYRNSHLHPRIRVRSLASLSCAGQYSREMCGVVGVKRDHWLCAASLCISLSLGYVAALFVGRTTIKSLVIESPPPTERSPISDGNFHEILDERPHIVFVHSRSKRFVTLMGNKKYIGQH